MRAIIRQSDEQINRTEQSRETTLPPSPPGPWRGKEEREEMSIERNGSAAILSVMPVTQGCIK